MADAWLGISSSELDSYDNQFSVEFGVAAALNGAGPWKTLADMPHWIILDFGVSYTVKQIRGRSQQEWDPIDVEIYVSDIKGTWGVAVATGISTWKNRTDWAGDAVIDVTDKVGRYLMVKILEAEEGGHRLYWGCGEKILDVYGSIYVAPGGGGRGRVGFKPIEGADRLRGIRRNALY